eukprot:2791092-Ditylum_brightwellii.AAC.1
MLFYWVRDRMKQGHFLVYWAPGKVNFGDFHTKHHGAVHNKRLHPFFLYMPLDMAFSMNSLECVACKGVLNLEEL